MKLIKKLFSPFIRDSRGVSTVEYALILVGVVAIVGTGMVVLGGNFQDLFDSLEGELTSQAKAVKKIKVK